MKTICASEFKAKCLAILDEVRDTGEIVTILKRGKAVARLIPSVSDEGEIPQASLFGTVRIIGNIEEPVLEPDAWESDGRAR